MQRGNILLAITAGLLTLGMVAPAHAEKPPSWAIGTFSGKDWKGNRLELTFQGTGVIQRSSWIGRRQTSDVGLYRGDGKLTFKGEEWQVDDTVNGIKVDKKDDGRNWLTLRRDESDGDDRPNNRPPHPGQNNDDFAPSWALGKFEGINRRANDGVAVNIRQTSITIFHRTKKPWAESGQWQDGYFNVGRKQYQIERNRREVLLVNRSNRNDYMRLVSSD